MRNQMRKVTVLLALAALALSALSLFAGSGTLVAQETEPSGPQFTIRCTWEGASSGIVDIGPVTCTLNVTNLPNPLQDDISVTLFTVEDTDDDAAGSAPSATVLSAHVSETMLDMPVFVSRRLPVAPPPPHPASPQVPDQPPKSL